MWHTWGIWVSMGMPAAMNTDIMVRYPTAAVPRASGMKLYLQREGSDAVGLKVCTSTVLRRSMAEVTYQ